MSYKINAENVIRPNNKKRRVIGILIGIIIIFIVELVFIYNYEAYLKISGSKTGMLSFMSSLGFVGNDFKIKITVDLLKNVLITWCNIWFINIIFIMLLLYITYQKHSKYRGMEYGSARWANKDEIAEMCKDGNSIPLANNLYLSQNNKKVKNLNELVIGDTGAGKSFSKLIPDIMEMDSSFIITDVKGTLFKQTDKILEKRGYKRRVLNFSDLRYTNTFNPFKYILTETDIDRLANSFIINSRREGANTGDSFWEDTAQVLLTSVIYYLHNTSSENKTFFRIMDLINSLEIINGKISKTSEYAKIIADIKEQDQFNPAVLNYEIVTKSPPETLQSVIISLQAKLRLWVNEELRIMTNSDEIDIDSLATEKTAIFVIIPAGDNTYKPITSMFITTVLTRLAYLANNVYNGRLPRHVSFELDEFANIGILPNFDGAITTFRSQNIRALMIVQGLQQIEKNYDKANKTIISNCAVFNYLGTTDTDTREQVVKRLGKTTIEETNKTKNKGDKGGGSESDRGLGRELLTLDELDKISDKSIVFVNPYYPFFCERYKTADNPLFKYLGNDDVNSPYAKNNVYINESYAEIYIQHKEEYERYKNQKNAEQKNKIDIFANSEDSGSVSSDRIKAKGEKKDESDYDRGQREMEQAFANNMMNKRKENNV